MKQLGDKLHEQFQQRRIDELETRVEASGSTIEQQHDTIQNLTWTLRGTRIVAGVAVTALLIVSWKEFFSAVLVCSL